jgi:sulfite exporter TauE/SafE
MSRRTPLALLAAVTTAIAVTVPAATASAQTPWVPGNTAAWAAPYYWGTWNVGLIPGTLPCNDLTGQTAQAAASGNAVWTAHQALIFGESGCATGGVV